jgi:hypothetical protein
MPIRTRVGREPHHDPAHPEEITMKSRRVLKVATAVAVATVLGAACSSGGDDDGAAPSRMHVAEHAAATEGATVGSPAAELQSTLSTLLQEHVYLAGIATGTALSGGELDAPAATLDANSVRLADAVASVYDRPAGDAFLELWRRHIGFFVDYTTARASNDTAGMDRARADLDGYRADFGAFLASANPNLTKEAVAEELVPHIQTLFAAIDAQAAKDPSQYDKLAEAASHMPMTAKVLAAGIAQQFPEKFGG